MSVARTCRRKRIQLNNDKRWKKKDAAASARKLARQLQREKQFNMRKK